MSRQLINEYRADLDRLRQVSGGRRESVLREAFKDLLKRWGKSQDLQFIAEHGIVTPKGNRIYVDGALLHGLRVPFGYWEAKDADDKLDDEIIDKFRKGYPKDNILFSDDVTAVLYQDGHEQLRAAMDDSDALLPLLTRFFAHERQEIADFKKAVKQFAHDLPAVLTALRGIIQTKRKDSKEFARAQDEFLKHARDAINPAVDEADVQEMLIQHILTEDIFAKVFENPDFHRQNNVAAALYALEDKLFGYGEKARLLKALGPYYAGIQSTAAMIESHTEKQGFLKGLYENFYKVYNPMAADRLGVVYTPSEIVRFMIKSTDWLCESHFGKNLIDKGVEILDPATGTGTFIVELLEHFRGNHEKLRHKYKEELHANEVAILPYYVANLNIEATYAAITGQFAEYPNLCFVDTLDNVAALGIYSGHQGDMFGSVSDENMARVKRQNERKISVIIGNPPYNANQQNENDNNKNRTYPRIDERIKQTYIKASTAQKTKLYDMYARFYRWACDRLEDDGIVAFVTNNSFIEGRTFDGFRKMIAKDFDEAWIIDLKGNARTSGERRRREGGNIFEDKIRVGVAICFLVKTSNKRPFTVRYLAVQDYAKEDDKREFVARRDLAVDRFEVYIPKPNGDWINQIEKGDWDDLLPLADKASKGAKGSESVFILYSLGVKTNRDEWVVSKSQPLLESLYRYTVDHYHNYLSGLPNKKMNWKDMTFDQDIKWTRKLRKLAAARRPLTVKTELIVDSLYRPFCGQFTTYAAELNEDQYQLSKLYRPTQPNPTFMLSGYPSAKPLQALCTDALWHHDTLEKTNGFPRYRYAPSGERLDNISDWAIMQFTAFYGGEAQITKDVIFAYCYAILHDPIYREKYAPNLKREFPRIPFYPGFDTWVEWGRVLLKMHIDYEKVKATNLTRIDTPSPKRAEGTHPKAKLKSDAAAGIIVIDEDTQLTGVPTQAWEYRLGNRSAVDWVLDQHKEKTPRDPTVREKFNTYRFSDYKESCIDLLAKVVTVSIETVAITEAMKALDRSDWV